MLEYVIQFLNYQIERIGLITERLGLVEQINQADRTFPASYLGKGQYTHIDIDSYKSLSYFRLNGEVTRELLDDDDNPIGGQIYESRTYPLIYFLSMPKDIFKTDNAYISHKIGENVFKHLSSINYSTFTSQLPQSNISIQVNGYNHSPKTVIEGEYEGGNIKYDLSKIYLSFGIDVVISAPQKCWYTWDCNDTNLVISQTEWISGTQETDTQETISFDPEFTANYFGQ